MNPEFLAYKYKSLKFPEQHSEKSIIQLGWKARKYIKWTQVHVNNDRDLLKKFGDLAVDDKILDLSLYPRFNEILLNVQFWRLDKDKWSVEPEHEAAWDRVRNLVVASNENPQLILSYLNEYFGGLDLIGNTDIYNIFRNIILLDLVTSVKKIPGISLSVINTSGGFCKVLDILIEKGYNISEFDSYSDEKEILELLGLPNLEEDTSLVKENFEPLQLNQFIIIEEKLSQSKLYSVDFKDGLVIITLNVNHELIKYIENNDTLKSFFIKYLQAYVKTSIDNPAISETMEDFNSYLALNLNREFLNI